MSIEVELINVSKKFGSVIAVDNISFKVYKNEFFSLLGPSGCGKTTTLRVIAGLEEPDSGIIKIGGEVVNNIPPHKRKVGLVFQGTALFPHLNVFENIAFGLKMMKLPKNEIKRRVYEVLELVKMSPEKYAKRKVNQLSGGEQQRVEIARALVTEPNVLLLDEPLGPLDLKIRRHMQIELKKLQKKIGTTFIYVTHDQSEALTMSDRVAVMKDGRILQIGKPKEIYENPKDVFVAYFIGEANFIEGKCISTESVEVKGLNRIKVKVDKELVGKRVALSIRPEKIRIARRLDGLDNVFDAVIEDLIYKGFVVDLEVRFTDEITLKVQAPPTEVANFKIGEKIKIGWNCEDGLPFVI